MAFASGTRVRLAYVAESTHGTTPTTPSMKELRSTGRNLNAKKALLESAEVRSDRERTVVRHGFRRVDGAVPFELALAAYDDFLEGALGGTFAAGTAVTSVSVDGTAETFTRASGSFVTDGYRKGDIVVTAGFSNGINNGTWVVTAVSALVLTVAVPTTGAIPNLITESGSGGMSVNLVGKRCDVGTTLKTFTFERQFLDVTQYQVLRGLTVNQLAISVKPEAIVNATMTLLGMSDGGFSGTPLDASIDAAAANDPMTSFEGVLYEAGVVSAIVTGVDLNLANGRALQPVVGSYTSPDVFEGQAKISGRLMLLFQDAVAYAKFQNETESQLWLRMSDPTTPTSFLSFVANRIKYSAGDIDPPKEGPIVIDLPFECLKDVTNSLPSLSIQRSNS